MNKSKSLILYLILILAFVLRFYQLGFMPNSLDWDEASLGYNAYSLLLTGNDEYGKFLPAQLRSFGDYKPPLYVYSSVPMIRLFGLNEFGTRVTSAVYATLAVLFTYYLFKTLFPSFTKKLPLLAMFFLAVSCWHLQFSRVAFEANTGLFWFICGTLFFLKSRNKPWLIIICAISYTLSLYSYHSLRLVVPVFVTGLAVIYVKELWRIKKFVLVSIFLSFLLVLPLSISLSQGLTARFSSVSSISPESLSGSIADIEFDRSKGDFFGSLVHNRRIVYLRSFLKGYLDHWDPTFLFVNGDPVDRHHAPDTGMLYLVELPIVLFGMYFLIFHQKGTGRSVIWLWFLVAPLASALTTGTPHAVRALLFLPTYQIFSAFGVYAILGRLRQGIPVFLNFKLLCLFLVMCYMLNVYRYLNLYYIHAPVEQAPSWQYGYKEAIQKVSLKKNNFSKIIITYKYDQPYIYFLFYEKTDPATYQRLWVDNKEIQRFNRSFQNMEFRNIEWLKDKQLPNTLLIGTPGEIPENDGNVIDKVLFPDGSTAFVIAKT